MPRGPSASVLGEGSFPGMIGDRELKVVLVEAGSAARRTVVYRGKALSVAF